MPVNQFVSDMSRYGISPMESMDAMQDVLNAQSGSQNNKPPIFGLISNSSVRRDLRRLAARALCQKWGRLRVNGGADTQPLENEWEGLL